MKLSPLRSDRDNINYTFSSLLLNKVLRISTIEQIYDNLHFVFDKLGEYSTLFLNGSTMVINNSTFVIFRQTALLIRQSVMNSTLYENDSTNFKMKFKSVFLLLGEIGLKIWMKRRTQHG